MYPPPKKPGHHHKARAVNRIMAKGRYFLTPSHSSFIVSIPN
jgi:hypothetical protein